MPLCSLLCPVLARRRTWGALGGPVRDKGSDTPKLNEVERSRAVAARECRIALRTLLKYRKGYTENGEMVRC
jgi:hypothetical protein